MVHGTSQSSRNKIFNPTVATNLLSYRDSRTVSRILSVQDQMQRSSRTEIDKASSAQKLYQHHQAKYNILRFTARNICATYINTEEGIDRKLAVEATMS